MIGYILNEIGLPEHALQSTTYDDYFLRAVEDNQLILHMFQHNGINMGLDDARLNGFEKGLQWYKNQKKTVTVRNSGGRSIVADDGVMNMALLFKRDDSMYANYEYYSEFIKSALAPLGVSIETGLIEGAYCPGTTDMSIDGKKFCGTAQRRVKDHVMLVCYISISGSQYERSMCVKGFYDACDEDPVRVDPHKMESLDELTGKRVSVDDVAMLLMDELKRRCDVTHYLDVTQLDDDALEKSKKRTLEQQSCYL